MCGFADRWTATVANDRFDKRPLPAILALVGRADSFLEDDLFFLGLGLLALGIIWSVQTPMEVGVFPFKFNSKLIKIFIMSNLFI